MFTSMDIISPLGDFPHYKWLAFFLFTHEVSVRLALGESESPSMQVRIENMINVCQ